MRIFYNESNEPVRDFDAEEQDENDSLELQRINAMFLCGDYSSYEEEAEVYFSNLQLTDPTTMLYMRDAEENGGYE